MSYKRFDARSQTAVSVGSSQEEVFTTNDSLANANSSGLSLMFQTVPELNIQANTLEIGDAIEFFAAGTIQTNGVQDVDMEIRLSSLSGGSVFGFPTNTIASATPSPWKMRGLIVFNQVGRFGEFFAQAFWDYGNAGNTLQNAPVSTSSTGINTEQNLKFSVNFGWQVADRDNKMTTLCAVVRKIKAHA